MAAGLHLYAVDREERRTVARGERQPVRVLDAAEAAVVLGEIERACREAARGIGERQPAPCGDFEFRQRLAGRAELLDEGTALLHAEHQAPESVFAQQSQGGVVVDVERRPADEGQAALTQQLHRRHVVCFDEEASVPHQPRERRELGLRFEQCQRREHDLAPRAGEFLRECDPVARAELAPFAADRLAQVDHVDGPRRSLVVELHHTGARPEILQGTECQAHVPVLSAMSGDRDPASSGGLRHASPVPGARRPRRTRPPGAPSSGRWPRATRASLQ